MAYTIFWKGNKVLVIRVPSIFLCQNPGPTKWDFSYKWGRWLQGWTGNEGIRKARDLENTNCYGFDCENRTYIQHCIQIYTYRDTGLEIKVLILFSYFMVNN